MAIVSPKAGRRKRTKARDRNVAFVPGATFFPERVEHEYLRLSFSRITEPDINEGLHRLALAITS